MTLLADRLVAATPSHRGVTASRRIPVVAIVLDAAAMTVALLLAVVGRQSGSVFGGPTALTVDSTLVGPLILVGWLLLLTVRGCYARDVFGAGTDEYKRVFGAGVLASGLLGVSSYLAHIDLSRGFFVILFSIGIPSMLLGRFALRRGIQAARRRGVLQRQVLIVGGPAYVDEIAAVLGRETWLGLSVVGALVPTENLAETTPAGVPVLGDALRVAAALNDHDVDVVFFAAGAHTAAMQLREVVWELEGHDVEIVVAPSMTDISSERIHVRPVGGLPLIHVTPPTWTDASRWGKRAFDVIGAGLALLALSPLLLAMLVWVKVYDRGPVLFRQVRVGRQGAEFSCLKIRTMVVDAEALLASLVSDDDTSVLFKMKEDPRITAPGRFLRRFSFDELPQLFNVLRGEMSLVGPRPPLAAEVAQYRGHTARRLHVRPGITGLWQVSGRSDLTWEEAVRLDLYYVDNWSMIQDVHIMLKTIGAVVSSRGAY